MAGKKTPPDREVNKTMAGQSGDIGCAPCEDCGAINYVSLTGGVFPDPDSGGVLYKVAVGTCCGQCGRELFTMTVSPRTNRANELIKSIGFCVDVKEMEYV